ncbi:FAD/NAD(P)-binding domain-containing protein [Mycena olivaceomarginata]|nr:FAD/NAD(P)-binding domain-containing protein [Mycena olivaceomarginata]
MSAKKNDDRKSVVVVGGGAAGVNIAPLSFKLDATKYNLVLINPRPFRVLLPATLRMVVSDVDNLGTTALVPYDKIFHAENGTFLQDSVRSIQEKSLTLGSGQEVPYDILILASGLSWTDPIAFPDFAQAGSYLLAGGGAVGCELAGELKDIWPEKEVTIVHKQRLLFNDTYTDRYRRSAANHLTARGVTLHLNETAGPATVLTKGGLKLSADLVNHRPPHPNTDFIPSFDADALTPAGFVKVKPTLQLLNHPNIFAAGDIVEWNEQKQAIKAGAHAKLVVQNVLSYISGNGSSLKTYKTGFEAILVTNGKRGGISYFGVLWGLIFGGWFTALLKSKSLLVPMFRKESGLV